MFVDGRLVCTAERPPFRCTWDPGTVVRGHHVRVVATLADGTQLTDNVRTKDLGYTERAHVDAVLVPIIVTDRGRFVRGLQRGDFEVLEDGVPQQLIAFASEDSPLDLVLAIDVSGSMEKTLDDVKDAVKQLLSKLRPGDAATLIGFNDTTFLVAEREKDQRAREDAVGLLTAWGGTALYDATVRAVDLVGRTPGRKGLILFSDGDDRHSLTPPDVAAARVQSGNAMLYRSASARAQPSRPSVSGWSITPSRREAAHSTRGTPRNWDRSLATSSPSCRINTCSRTCPAIPAPMVHGEASGCACGRASTTCARGAVTRQSGPAGPERRRHEEGPHARQRLVLLCWAPTMTAQQAPPEQPPFRTGIELVTVDATVLDHQGRPHPRPPGRRLRRVRSGPAAPCGLR